MNEAYDMQRSSSAELLWKEVEIKRRAFTYSSDNRRNDFTNIPENQTFLPPIVNKHRKHSDDIIGRLRSKTVDAALETFLISRITKEKNNILDEKVKEFMTKEIPGKPPSTLRYIKPRPVQIKSSFISRKMSNSPINTNSCPNLHMYTDKTWSYNYKPGKCRYLRCPPSPILQPSEIFKN